VDATTIASDSKEDDGARRVRHRSGGSCRIAVRAGHARQRAAEMKKLADAGEHHIREDVAAATCRSSVPRLHHVREYLV
jgi:hypothetical protein